MENGAAIIGPAPPMSDDEYDPEEIKKAEEYKKQGNDYVKGKCHDIYNFPQKDYILLGYFLSNNFLTNLNFSFRLQI